MSLGLSQVVQELEEKTNDMQKQIERLSELQMRHENQDELRAIKQDQLIANIQSLMGNLKEYTQELHEIAIKNAEDINKVDNEQIKTATRVKILYGVGAIILGAIMTAVFEYLPTLITLISKGK